MQTLEIKWLESKSLLNSHVIYYSQTQLWRTVQDWPFLFIITVVCYNLDNLCTKMTNLTLKTICYNRVFVINRDNRVLLYFWKVIRKVGARVQQTTHSASAIFMVCHLAVGAVNPPQLRCFYDRNKETMCS